MKCPYIRKTEVTQSIEKTNPDDETGVYDKRIVTRTNTHKHSREC